MHEHQPHQAQQALTDLVKEIHAHGQQMADRTAKPTADDAAVDLKHLPAGAPHFLGRQDELSLLDQAWSNHTPIVTLIAPGGVGKTSLIKRWLDQLRADHWRGAERVYGWSFYSQGTDEKRQASDEAFLAAALAWFGVAHDPALSAWDKGTKLATAVVVRRTLLVLDGLEPLQYPPGHTMAGELRAPGVEALLYHLATAGQPGLCLISSREALTNLAEYQRSDDHTQGPLCSCDLGNLSQTDGARLLYQQGVKRAGAAAITANDDELQAASEEVDGHALTLTLLGSFLAKAYFGDIRQRDKILYAKANQKTGGHAFRVIAAYETWLESEGEKCAAELATFRLLGYFDRPASAKQLQALREAPAIPGLTEALQTQDESDWRCGLHNLQAVGLLRVESDGGVDAHPLIREYLAAKLQRDLPEAWRDGHRRLYEYLKASVPHQPDDLEGLQPLYQAVAHGCAGGLWREAWAEVYQERILRGDEGYSIHKLGAFGADLGALAGFFAEPWTKAQPAFAAADQGWLLNLAGFSLRALGRLAEAEVPLLAGAELDVRQEDWKSAAADYSNLSQLQLTLGRVAAAVSTGQTAVAHAQRSGDAFQHIARLSALADALHQQGAASAVARSAEAEGLQEKNQPAYPLLYSVQGFHYCELLLGAVEWATWQAWMASHQGTAAAAPAAGDSELAPTLAAVTWRAEQTLAWVMPQDWLLDIALDHLTLARCALYRALLSGSPPAPADAPLATAVAKLRESGNQDDLPRGLLTRAWFYRLQGRDADARADLAEVERITRRGGMKLFLADLHLTRARLFFRDNLAAAQEDLAQAETLIKECGYGRRLPELAEARKYIPARD